MQRAQRRAEHLPLPIVWATARAERLPFPDEYFQTVVGTLVLCTVADPLAALREARRVLQKEGELRLLEHGQSGLPRRGWLQDRLTPLWRLLAGGCHLNRDPLALVEASGFTTRQVLSCESWKLFPIFRLDEIVAGRADN